MGWQRSRSLFGSDLDSVPSLNSRGGMEYRMYGSVYGRTNTGRRGKERKSERKAEKDVVAGVPADFGGRNKEWKEV